MYQPKIRDDLIKQLYQTAKAQKMPMTKLVNKLLESALENFGTEAMEVNDKQEEYKAKNLKDEKR